MDVANLLLIAVLMVVPGWLSGWFLRCLLTRSYPELIEEILAEFRGRRPESMRQAIWDSYLLRGDPGLLPGRRHKVLLFLWRGMTAIAIVLVATGIILVLLGWPFRGRTFF